jgi:hypothetical protein
MENQNGFQESSNEELRDDIEPQQIINVNKFVLLSIFSFGLYEIWWIYKTWRFFRQKEKLDIMPACRALFSIFFLYALFTKIMQYASVNKYKRRFPPFACYIGFFAINFLAYLPEPWGLISVFSFIFLIPPFQALNYAKQTSTTFVVNEQTSFNGRQMILIIGGIIGWVIILPELI